MYLFFVRLLSVVIQVVQEGHSFHFRFLSAKYSTKQTGIQHILQKITKFAGSALAPDFLLRRLLSCGCTPLRHLWILAYVIYLGIRIICLEG